MWKDRRGGAQYFFPEQGAGQVAMLILLNPTQAPASGEIPFTRSITDIPR
jgi:hypothetical protein